MTFDSGARAVAICAVLTVAATTAAEASMPSACSMVPLANVRTILGEPVIISKDEAPTVEDGLEGTTCLYMVSGSAGMTVSVWLGRGPHILASHRAYANMPQRHGAEGMHGNTQAIVSVVTGSKAGLIYHDALSAKVLAAVLAKL